MSMDTAETHDAREPVGFVLEAALVLAQTQLIGQLADETSLDGRRMGTLGFSGALLAADVAVGGTLGVFWWFPLIVLALATLCCVGPMFAIGADFRIETDLGPSADAFYLAYGKQSPTATCEQLLADLDRAFSHNARRLSVKRRALRVAVVAIAVGLPASAVLSALRGVVG